jgi:hypothetical protein
MGLMKAHLALEPLLPRCAACRQPMEGRGDAVNHGDMLFHADCAPNCCVCGRRLGAADVWWRCEAEVVSEPWGYGVRPIRFWCRRCSGDWRTGKAD